MNALLQAAASVPRYSHWFAAPVWRFVPECEGQLPTPPVERLLRYTNLLAKPRIDFRLASANVLESFINDKKSTKGLTTRGEESLRGTVGGFLRWRPVPLPQATREHLVRFLGFYDTKPWRKHAFYRANKSFWKWASRTYDMPNPMIDRWGHAVIEAPKTPKTVLYTMTPEKVHRLLEAASCIRDRAAISLLADSGAKRSEIVAIKTNDVDLGKNWIAASLALPRLA